MYYLRSFQVLAVIAHVWKDGNNLFVSLSSFTLPDSIVCKFISIFLLDFYIYRLQVPPVGDNLRKGSPSQVSADGSFIIWNPSTRETDGSSEQQLKRKSTFVYKITGVTRSCPTEELPVHLLPPSGEGLLNSSESQANHSHRRNLFLKMLKKPSMAVLRGWKD